MNELASAEFLQAALIWRFPDLDGSDASREAVEDLKGDTVTLSLPAEAPMSYPILDAKLAGDGQTVRLTLGARLLDLYKQLITRC